MVRNIISKAVLRQEKSGIVFYVSFPTHDLSPLN
jgi:hypothetical protein